jgi:hypothetical protein
MGHIFVVNHDLRFAFSSRVGTGYPLTGILNVFNNPRVLFGIFDGHSHRRIFCEKGRD